MIVVDASVIVKWLLNDESRKSDTSHATDLMRSVVKGEVTLIQPVHWLLEVSAVLARLNPLGAEKDIALLQAMEFEVVDDPVILRRGVNLALKLKQHLFDTLYHALALETPGAKLITADRRYLTAASGFGSISSLSDWYREHRIS